MTPMYFFKDFHIPAKTGLYSVLNIDNITAHNPTDGDINGYTVLKNGLILV